MNSGVKAAWVAGAALLVSAILSMAWFLNRSEFDDATLGVVPAKSGTGDTANVAHPRPAPSFELPMADGKPFKLDSLKGNAVVVHFWASWCTPCLAEIPKWLDFAAHWNGKSVRFVAVSLDQAWPEALKIMPTDRLPAGVISVMDRMQTLPDLFGTYQYPETYLLNSDLQIVSKWVGAQDWASPKISQALEAVLPRS